MPAFRRQISPYLGAGAHAQLAESKKTNKSAVNDDQGYFDARCLHGSRQNGGCAGQGQRDVQNQLALKEEEEARKESPRSWGYGAMTGKADSFISPVMYDPA